MGLLVAASLVCGALAAVALELVPEADEGAGPWLTAAAGLLAGRWSTSPSTPGSPGDDKVKQMRRSVTPPRRAADGGRGDRADRAEAARGEAIAVGLFLDGVPVSIALGL